MEPKELAKRWSEPDNTRLTPRQFSIRLPVHVSAKISALCEMFPKKSRTEIIGDLLSSALEQVEEGLSAAGTEMEERELEERGQDPSQYVLGDRGRYYSLWRKYEDELERETEQAGSQSEVSARRNSRTKDGEQPKRPPEGKGASAPHAPKARPAEGTRGDQGSRKRGGRRRPATG